MVGSTQLDIRIDKATAKREFEPATGWAGRA
jgi:hypothetical protein